MINYDITKTLNLSKEQRKRFNKVLSESGSGSGNSSGNVSNDEYDIYVEIDNEPIVQSLTDSGVFLNHFDDAEPIVGMLGALPINIKDMTFKPYDIVNIYI